MSQVEMANKLRAGFFLLAGRSAFSKILQIVSSLILAYKLVPSDYGSFGIIYGFVASLIFLSDIGLGDILIQKKEAITKDELSSYLGLRLILGCLGMLFFMAIYPSLTAYYKFTFNYHQYAFLIALILPLESFIGAAIVQTQKDLHFKDFAKIELYESLSLYIIQISLAFLNFGVWAFFIAILSSRIIKTLLCLKILKYNIVPKFNFSIFKGKYLNGFYFQLNSILPTSKAMILPLILSLFLDIHSIGIIFWVSSLVSVPLVLVYNYNSVLFPALSKFQDNHTSAKELAGQSMEKMILILVFVFGLGGIVGDQIIALAFNENWADAKNVIFVCALYHLVYAMRTMCYPILYAKNLASKRTIAELLLVILEYAAVYFFCKDFGTKGYFVSLIFINILAFYFLYYHSRDWLLRSTFWRFHLSIVGVLIIYGLERWFNFPTKNINSLMIEAISFSVFLFIFFYLLDLKFRMLFLEIIHKVKKNASKI